MNRSQTMERVKMVADEIPGYDYGSADSAKSPITTQEFEELKQSAAFNEQTYIGFGLPVRSSPIKPKNWLGNGAT